MALLETLQHFLKHYKSVTMGLGKMFLSHTEGRKRAKIGRASRRERV